MAFVKFQNVGITAMACAVPYKVIDNLHYMTEYYGEDNVKAVVEKIGVYERRFADENTCSSDLCFAAADRLLTDNHIDRSEIDLLIFISQTPDYRMPATSVILQDRLGLPTTCMAYDINLGCAAFLFGLTTVYSLMQTGCFRKALLLDGETRSKVYSPRDRHEAFIFGDAGAAALIERNDKFGKSYFSLNANGGLHDLIMIPAGGYRHMSSAETVKEKVVDQFGNMRSDEQAQMKGQDVFAFTLTQVPKDVKKVLEFSAKNLDDMDYIVLHQANAFMNSYLVKKMKLDKEKIKSTIHKFGNTSSVSVPLTIVSELKDKLNGHHTLLASAFGVGMTWASGVLDFNDCKISDIVEVENGKSIK